MLFQILLCVLPLTMGHLILPPLVKNATEDGFGRFFEADPSTGIVGGDVAPPGSHPWLVAILQRITPRALLCGGSILTKQTILTAAHCLAGTSVLAVVAGTHNFYQGGQMYQVQTYQPHPAYSGEPMFYNDIGLVYLSTELVFSAAVRPVSLSFAPVGGGVPVLAAGWGMVRNGVAGNGQLLQVSLTALSDNECNQRLSQMGLRVEARSQLCTLRAAGFGTCEGDSGTPLIDQRTQQQIGIASWVLTDLCGGGYPDVFARVSSYEAFIKQNIK